MTLTPPPKFDTSRLRLAVKGLSSIGLEAEWADDPRLLIPDANLVRNASWTVTDVFETPAAKARNSEERAASMS
jgi:hypothetical protein